MPHQTGFLLLLDEMDGEEKVEVEVDLVDGLHVHLELVRGGRPERDDGVAEAAEDGGGGRGGCHPCFHLAWHFVSDWREDLPGRNLTLTFSFTSCGELSLFSYLT